MIPFLIKSGDTIVQAVRNYPKGFLFVLGVVAVLGFIF